MRIKFTALALAAILPLASVQAADMRNMRDMRDDMRSQWQQGNQQMMMQELNLDDAQRQQFQEKQEAFWAKQEKQRNEFRSKQDKQRQSYWQKQQNQRDKHHAELRSLLNPEQRTAFDRHQEKMDSIRDQQRSQRFGQQNNNRSMKSGYKNQRNNNRGMRNDQYRSQSGMNMKPQPMPQKRDAR